MSKKLTKIEEYEAKAVAQELLAQLVVRSEVSKHLQREYLVTPHTARRIVKAAEEAIMAPDEKDAARARQQHIARLEALYRRSLLAKKFSTCERILSQLGEIHGVKRPQHIVHTGSVQVDAEFDGRTEQELQFYIDNGHWPEEAPRGTTASAVHQNVDPNDPLKGLH